MALRDEVQAERFDEGRFADAGDTGDAEAQRFSGVGKEGVEEDVGLLAVVGAGGFEEGDGLGDGAAVVGEDLSGEVEGLRYLSPALRYLRANGVFPRPLTGNPFGLRYRSLVVRPQPLRQRIARAPGMPFDRFPVAADQRLLLRPPPPLDPPLCRQRFIPTCRLLRPHQFDWPPLVRVPIDLARLVLRNTSFQLVGMPDVVRTIGTTQHVDEEGFHVGLRQAQPERGGLVIAAVISSPHRLLDLLQHVLRARRNWRAGAVNPLHSRVVQELVVLPRDHAADEDDDVVGALLLQ